jgi:hypothetical protein
MVRTPEEPSSPSTVRARGRSTWAREGSRDGWDAGEVLGGAASSPLFGGSWDDFW